MISIMATLQFVAGFASLCGLIFDSVGVPHSFRYRLLVKLAFVIGGTIALIAVFTVVMKWTLAGTSTEYRTHLSTPWVVIDPNTSGGGRGGGEIFWSVL